MVSAFINPAPSLNSSSPLSFALIVRPHNPIAPEPNGTKIASINPSTIEDARALAGLRNDFARATPPTVSSAADVVNSVALASTASGLLLTVLAAVNPPTGLAIIASGLLLQNLSDLINRIERERIAGSEMEEWQRTKATLASTEITGPMEQENQALIIGLQYLLGLESTEDQLELSRYLLQQYGVQSLSEVLSINDPLARYILMLIAEIKAQQIGEVPKANETANEPRSTDQINLFGEPTLAVWPMLF